MSRLTCKYDGMNIVTETIVRGHCMNCDEYCNTIDVLGGDCDNCAIQMAFDKLAEYEDLEEQGLLLKLPFPLGTKKLYLVDTYEIDELDITGITLYKSNEKDERPNETIICVDYCDFYYDDFGKTVFLTKEEAELALKRLEGADKS